MIHLQHKTRGNLISVHDESAAAWKRAEGYVDVALVVRVDSLPLVAESSQVYDPAFCRDVDGFTVPSSPRGRACFPRDLPLYEAEQWALAYVALWLELAKPETIEQQDRRARVEAVAKSLRQRGVGMDEARQVAVQLLDDPALRIEVTK